MTFEAFVEMFSAVRALETMCTMSIYFEMLSKMSVLEDEPSIKLAILVIALCSPFSGRYPQLPDE